jgi:hypothetical protein
VTLAGFDKNDSQMVPRPPPRITHSAFLVPSSFPKGLAIWRLAPISCFEERFLKRLADATVVAVPAG